MQDTLDRAVAIVGVGAILPDAPNAPAFWSNVKAGRYSISEVTPDRWDSDLYYDPDHAAPDKTYSKIGGWVREFVWDPLRWKLAIPPRVVEAMDGAQRWGVACTREALADYGYPERPLDTERTAVILGNAMGGEQHYLTSLRAYFPEYARELAECASFASLPDGVRREIAREWHARMGSHLPPITEDSMPGELANCLAGRIANLFNFRGPNFTCDAACASAMAAIRAAADGLAQHDFDVALTGGVDRNMGAPTFIKFCKIGALSATGSRPYAEGADGFVMGEGAALFLLKRLEDAETAGDRIYAVIRGIGASSDGKGKGITAPNPVGQKIAVERAWLNAGLSPVTATLIEGHGTSTSVGDVVEVESIAAVLKEHGINGSRIALGSVKSNIGHLKGAAGAAGILKTALALHEKVLPPSVHCEQPNSNIDFAHSPLEVNTELRPWDPGPQGVRRAGASAFGFGGTNFHVVMEEYVPGSGNGNRRRTVAVSQPTAPVAGNGHAAATAGKPPIRGASVIGAQSEAGIVERLRVLRESAARGAAPSPAAPSDADLRAPYRLAIDYADAADLAAKCAKALAAYAGNQPAAWRALQAQGVYRGHGSAPKVAFLYPGQGSQYVNMLRELKAREPIVAATFAEADEVMAPILGKPLTSFLFVDAAETAKAEEDLRQTAITQPAVLAADIALTRLLAAYGVKPDMAMGHSLGEYAALVASGALSFADALEAVSARGREMTRVSMADNGRMAAVFGPIGEIERILQTVPGYVVVANHNSQNQAVIGGATKAVEDATARFQNAGFNVVPLPVSHAFHTSIVAPASAPLRQMLERLHLQTPGIPTVANVNGEFYPMGPDAPLQMLDILARQVAAPVQFIKGLHTLYAAGARVFVEVGPKKALYGFAEDALGAKGDMLALFANHPKFGDLPSFNQALCGMYAAGLGGGAEAPVATAYSSEAAVRPERSNARPVVITGAALGLPGNHHVFDEDNVGRILRGEQLIDVIPNRYRRAILDKHITRLVKSDNGGPAFETIDNPGDVLKLAGRGAAFDLTAEFGIPADRIAAMDRATCLAVAAGIDALRDAGIPLVMRYKNTTKGTRLPDRWSLPESLRDDTGVIFASVFPGYDSFADEMARYSEDHLRREQLALLEDLAIRSKESNGHSALSHELERRIAETRAAIEKAPYFFDRRFLFRVLSMGHSQFAELIGARGPNTQINSACASTTQAIGLAQDWIAAGRCRRVIVISADDVASDHLIEWFGAGFLASGAAATDAIVENAAVPFDRRRHGMIIGMGAAAMVVESEEAAAERGLMPICEVVGAATANSAFHGTRLDPEHIAGVMESLVKSAEERTGISRQEMAKQMVFVSHETYTPARGGSASAEVHALRQTFEGAAPGIVITNTKGFTGHAMGAGIEDVVAVKSLETGCVPPVANFKEPDPELGPLNLSRGGAYPAEFALRLGAGFGSQISMVLLRRTAANGVRHAAHDLGYEYRIADRAAWQQWLSAAAGGAAQLEVVHHTLRVCDAAGIKAPVPAAQHAPVVKTPAPMPVTKPVPVTKPAPAEKPNSAAPSIGEKVLAIVAQKTGYPPEMLALDLDLEADLGIDTVKQAEMFAAVRETFGIARDPNMKLRDFPTLGHVVRYAEERGGDTKRPVDRASTRAAAPPPAPAAPPAPVQLHTVRDKVLAIVAEKTGYPVDMLDPELDLEADLGIDTVKQAEMFAAVRETFGIARDPNLKLRDFPTLGHVVRFAEQRSGAAAPPAESAPAAAAAPAAPAGNSVRDKVLAIVAEKTGYPVDMLDPELDLEADLGIDTVKQAEMFAAVRETFGIARDPNLKLRDFPTLGHVVRFAEQRSGAAAPPAESAPAAPANNPVRDKVLAIVAEKTGYPVDMLDPELDLEADLGIDTVKQAEMFASVREAFGIERDPDLKLRDFPTLGHVVRFAEERSAQASEKVAEQPRPAATEAVAPHVDSGIPRRVPVAVLRPPLAFCKNTGIDLAAGRRVLVVGDHGGAGEALAERLRAAGVEVLDAPDDGVVHGVYWLPALDPEGEIAGMDFAAWHEALAARLKHLYTLMRGRYEQIGAPGTFLVAATRLGGRHGYDEAGAVNPLGGAVTGLVKTYQRERPDALVKAIDFEAGADAAQIADLLMAETLHDPGAVEIGYQGGNRWGVVLEEQPFDDSRPGLALDKETVFLVTGAAGSIVSAITTDLAKASGGTFHLLDLTPEPDPEDPDLKAFVSDRDGLKRELFTRLQARGEKATPARVEKELAALERAHAAAEAIGAVRRAGGTAYYCSVNLTDARAVEETIDQVRQRSGRVDVLLHAAGMERSHFLPDKGPREFDLVFDVKADGWFHLLHALGDMHPRAMVAFSSIAGRFGNAGQADYSSANDLLCKIASHWRSARPETRALTIDWTAWAGIGMASRGSIPKMMELAGIEMLPAEIGVPWIRRELTHGGKSGEVVAAGKLGILLQDRDATGGAELGARFEGPMAGGLARIGGDGRIAVDTTLDPAIQPFLYDHQIEGTPVLPGVMGIEAFAEVAAAMVPGWHVASIEDVRFLAPFKFYRGEPRTLTIEAGLRAEGEDIVADCRLLGRRTLPNQPDPVVTTHFTASVRLAKGSAAPAVIVEAAKKDGALIEAAGIYQVYFHGPAYQVVRQAWVGKDGVTAEMAANLPANHQPESSPLTAAPRLIELCFQAAGLWEMSEQHRMGLPWQVDRITLLRAPDAASLPLAAKVIPAESGDSFDAEVVDSAGNKHISVKGYRTVEFRRDFDASLLKGAEAVTA